jgi:hypothetical protein
MTPAHITRLLTFAQHGQPTNYAASDLMRSDVEAVLLNQVVARSPITDSQIWNIWCTMPEVAEGEDDSMEARFIAACRRVIKELK